MLMYSLLGMILTVVSRQFVHLYKFPRSWFMLPAFLFMVTYGQFIRFWALITPHKIGEWGTRQGVDERGEKGAWELDAQHLVTIDLKQATEGNNKHG
jgi:hypothetical protein